MTRGKHSFSNEDNCADAPLHFGKLEIRGRHVIADDEILHELNGQRQRFSEEPEGGFYAATLV